MSLHHRYIFASYLLNKLWSPSLCWVRSPHWSWWGRRASPRTLVENVEKVHRKLPAGTRWLRGIEGADPTRRTRSGGWGWSLWTSAWRRGWAGGWSWRPGWRTRRPARSWQPPQAGREEQWGVWGQSEAQQRSEISENISGHGWPYLCHKDRASSALSCVFMA